MRSALVSPPDAAPAVTTVSPRQPARSVASLAEPLALAAVSGLAVWVRWPYLWEIPRFTDELQEVLWSLAIARGEILPLTAVDSYYGPLWSYLLAGLFLLSGPSAELPRLVASVLGAALVVLTYLFARDVAGRWPAAIAAGLMLTSPGHVVINSHTARSNSITPLLTTAALWLVFRALESDRWSAKARPARHPDPRLLVPAGFLFGLALQTHLSVVALLPGVVAYALWRGQPLLRSPWPYLAALATTLGYVNMLIYNLTSDFWSLRHARSLQAGYSGGRSTDLEYVLTNLQNLVQSLARLVSGTIDVPDDPSRVVYLLLALTGLALLAGRGGLLFVLAGASLIAILPLFNPRYGPILSGRYLVPLLPLLFMGIGCAVVAAAARLAALVDGRERLARSGFAMAAGFGLVTYPLLSLGAYYEAAVHDGRTNEPLHRLVEAIIAARHTDEAVLLDEGLAQEQLGAGGTDLKAFRMLLETRRLPLDVAKVSDLDERQLGTARSLLFLMETKKRASLERGLAAARVSPEVESASGSGHRYAVYRITAR